MWNYPVDTIVGDEYHIVPFMPEPLELIPALGADGNPRLRRWHVFLQQGPELIKSEFTDEDALRWGGASLTPA